MLNRKEFIARIAEENGITKVQATENLDMVLDGFISSLDDGGVKLQGFGNFEVIDRNARQGRNPKTGETLMVPATKSVKFKLSKVIKDMVK